MLTLNNTFRAKALICLMGPTASGKTLLAMELVKYLPCDIISVDSAMVYRGMDIGTAKPSLSQLLQTPHRLVDIKDPADTYSVGQFCADALKSIEEIHTKKRIPLLVGGTMMYFNSLQQGLANLPPANLKLRNYLDQEYEKLGSLAMHNQLATIDKETAARVNCQDWRRIQRGLEIFHLTGKTMSQLISKRLTFPHPILNIIISPTNRQILRDRITTRFLQMLEQGFIAEVQQLFQREDLNAQTPALQAAGYKQIWQYLEGKIDVTEMRRNAIVTSCQLAKRQLTWLRHWENSYWFESDTLLDMIPSILKKIEQFDNML